jgi:hypothetical protein
MTTKHSDLPPSPDKSSLELTEELIRLRAYQIYEARGREDGYDTDDWLLAEAEIIGKNEAAPAKQEQPFMVKSKRKGTAA